MFLKPFLKGFDDSPMYFSLHSNSSHLNLLLLYFLCDVLWSHQEAFGKLWNKTMGGCPKGRSNNSGNFSGYMYTVDNGSSNQTAPSFTTPVQHQHQKHPPIQSHHPQTTQKLSGLKSCLHNLSLWHNSCS